jgi:hypothetical protein
METIRGKVGIERRRPHAMSRSINDRGAIPEYLRYLIAFADEVKAQNRVTQEDVERVNREVDELSNRLSEVGLRGSLCEALRKCRLPVVTTDPKRPRTIMFYVVVILFFGWIGVLLAALRESRNSDLRKEHLAIFRREIISLLAEEEVRSR